MTDDSRRAQTRPQTRANRPRVHALRGRLDVVL